MNRLALLTCLSLAITSNAVAQENYAEPAPRNSQTVYTQRDIVLEPRTFRGDLLVSFDRGGASADFGITFGVVKNLELGITRYRQGGTRHTGSFLRNPHRGSGLFPILFSPGGGLLNGGFGDINLTGRYRFLNRSRVELGVDFGVVLPTNTAFGLWIAIPGRVQFGKSVSLDFGAELSVNLREGDGAVFDFRLPLELNGNVSDVVYLGVSTSLGIATTGGLHIPLGVHIGFAGTLGKRSVRSDFELEFAFPSLINADDDDTFIDSGWLFGVNYRIHYNF